MKESNLKTPRMLREGTLTGIGFAPTSSGSPVLVFIGFVVGFLIGALI